MAGRLIEIDPEEAFQHALAASRRGGRLAAVREAVGITAYAAGHYGEALREFRTFRRISGSNVHLPVMADCERGLGRPDRALDLARTEEAESLDSAGKAELAMVVSGARTDLGQLDAAVSALEIPQLDLHRAFSFSPRLFRAYADALDAVGRSSESEKWRRQAGVADTALGLDDDLEPDIIDLGDEEEPAPAAVPKVADLLGKPGAQEGTRRVSGQPTREPLPAGRVDTPEGEGPDSVHEADGETADDAAGSAPADRADDTVEDTVEESAVESDEATVHVRDEDGRGQAGPEESLGAAPTTADVEQDLVGDLSLDLDEDLERHGEGRESVGADGPVAPEELPQSAALETDGRERAPGEPGSGVGSADREEPGSVGAATAGSPAPGPVDMGPNGESSAPVEALQTEMLFSMEELGGSTSGGSDADAATDGADADSAAVPETDGRDA